MTIKKVFIKACFFFFCLINLFFLSKDALGQQAYRDPFEDQFPEVPKESREELVEEPVVAKKPLPEMMVTGILYDRRGASRVIVNDTIYRVGDKVSEGVTIHKIEKDKVFVLFEGGLFELGIVRKDIGKKEKR